MRALLYECASGISGDMNLGALIDLGVPYEYLVGELAALRLDGEFALCVERAHKMGIHGTRATVVLAASAATQPDHGGGRDHDHHHNHDHHHSHNHDSAHERSPDTHVHRRYRDIRRLIENVACKTQVKAIASRIFAALAEAEAKIHGIEQDEVEFHEVGSIDSIVDVFGAAICLDYLAVDIVLAGPVELGTGFVRCAHGRLPVPTPATLEILQQIPCTCGGVDGEATTPTGAAILKATVHRFGDRLSFMPLRTGYGIGQRDFAIPNVLRVSLCEVDDATGKSSEMPPYRVDRTNVEIAANIDDMSPEAIEPLMDQLFQAGASDVFVTPIMMKKSRMAQTISILAQPHKVDELVDVLFENSTTIGVRLYAVGKRMLVRKLQTVATRFGDVRVKVVTLPFNGRQRWKVEHDDVRRISVEQGVPYLSLYREIELAVQQSLGEHSPVVDRERS
ncbi:nickel pincer cofactor biosynthesis protein LarC [Paraburkholderia sediminicola]|uniref:nickel pincer cofactor biosynthesis protein LarC n=1 Tax=Paraburkholderia sediminicola TaxID=458836 RepID=UPI0038BADC30